MPENPVVQQVGILRSSFDSGRTKEVSARKKILKKLLAALKNNHDEVLQALKSDLNKSEGEAVASELALLYQTLQHTLKRLCWWSRSRLVSAGIFNFPAYGRIMPEPYGVVLVGGTWNYPFLLTLEPLIGAIAAGNTVLVKLPESADSSAGVLRKIIAELAEPQVVISTNDAWDNVIAARYDYIFYTGSERMGRIIMRKAAETLTPLTLELGGKSPCIVTENANLDVAAKRIVWGKFLNAGQTCVAPDYLLVQSSVKEPLMRKIRIYVQKFYGANPQDCNDFGRIVSDFHFKRLTELLGNGRLICGGENDAKIRYIAPTVVDMVDWDSPLMQQEIFGPILPVMEFDTLPEVVADLKMRPKPLALYLFSSSRAEKALLATQCSSGGMAVNDTVMQLAAPKLPFGGIGASGMGAYHGKKTFDTFTHFKSILHKFTWGEIPLRFPPLNGWKLLIIRFFSR